MAVRLVAHEARYIALTHPMTSGGVVDRVPIWLDYGFTDGPTNFVFAPDRNIIEIDDWRQEGISIINNASVEFRR